ncbi:MAG: hypothetical protein E7643_07295 [Ruminococcaceae bacterium]|nr:hypothetical protein [Oscillospiraceae bacterium]
MKKFSTILLAVMCLFILSSCDTNDSTENAYLSGKVLTVYEGSCLLEVTDKGNTGFASGEVALINTNVEGCPIYAVGDFLKVEFDGTVAESYPPQILTVFSVEKTDVTPSRSE